MKTETETKKEKEKQPSDFQIAVHNSRDIPKIYIGAIVNTENGIGIVVSLSIQHNGLHIMPDKTKAIVWFGTEKSSEETGFVHKEFDFNQLEIIN